MCSGIPLIRETRKCLLDFESCGEQSLHLSYRFDKYIGYKVEQWWHYRLERKLSSELLLASTCLMELHFASPRMDMSLTFQNPFSSPMPLLRTDERWVLA